MTRWPLAAAVLAALLASACDPSEAPVAPLVPVGAPQVVCQGVPRAACQEAFDTISSGATQGQGPIVRIVVRCSSAVCTNLNGEAVVTAFFANGGDETSSYGWSSEPAVPAPPGG